mgnify:CR=1 FL=1
MVAMVGKYMDLVDAYKSLTEALGHAGIQNKLNVKIEYIDSERVESDISLITDADAILIPGGFGSRGIEGKISAARYARENKVPYLGICLGMQIAVIEYARNKCGLKGANSTEFDPKTEHPVVGLIEEWIDQSNTKKEDERKSKPNFLWSSIYETLPHGVENEQPNYLNTLVLVKSNYFPKPSIINATRNHRLIAIV